MANTVKVKRSATPAKVPTTSDLQLGEIAVNTYDGKMYIKKNNGTDSIVQIGDTAGSGDVVGPSSATDNAITRFDTTTGKLIQNSLVIIDDTGSVTGVNSLTAQSLTVNNNATLGSSNTDSIDVRGRISSDLDPETNNAKDIGTNGRNWRDGFFGRALNTLNLIISGNLTFTGTGNRITGDFSNATFANRAMFQTSTTNGSTAIEALPNGTAGNATWTAYNNSDPTNASFISIGARTTTDARIESSIRGSGTYLPLTMYTGGSERLRIDTSGDVAIGTTSSLFATANRRVLAVNGTSTALMSLSVGSSTSTAAYMFYSNSNLSITNATTGGIINFLTENTERMRITNAGGISFGSSGTAYGTSGQILQSNGNAPPTWVNNTAGGVSSITGTANQITASASTGAVTLSLPATINVNTSGNAATATNASNTSSVSNAVGSSFTWTGVQNFTGNGNTASAAGIGMSAFSTGGNGAIMAFHRGGVYAVNFGLDSDNVMRIGGWSAAANRWQLDMSGNETLAGRLTATAWTTTARNYSSEWIEFPNHSGLYSPLNAAHFYPNPNSYGSWRCDGSRNGWQGIEFQGQTTLMMNNNAYGFHKNDQGWRFYNENGSGYFPGLVQAGWSDKRLKENFRPITAEALDIINQLQTYRFNWNAKVGEMGLPIEVGAEEVGCVAQEVQAIFPDAVAINKSANIAHKNGTETQTDYLTINYNKLTPLLIQSVNELTKQINELRTEIAELKGQK